MRTTWTQRLVRGGASGIAGGTAAAVVLWMAVEPVLSRAIALEGAGADAHDHAGSEGTHSHSHEAGEVVTRLQQQIGGTLTVIIVAALMGLAFSVVYARSRHRLPGRTDLGKSTALGMLAFVVMALLPALVIPANPPGVGDPDTVNYRTLCYFVVIGLGVLVVGAAFGTQRFLRRRGTSPELTWLAVAAVVTLGAGAVLLFAPGPADVVPGSVPAALLWDFRVGSLAQLGAMWGVIGLVHGAVTHRAEVARPGAGRPMAVRA